MTPKDVLEAGLKADLLDLFTSPNPPDMNAKLNIFCEKLANRIDAYTKTQIGIDCRSLISSSQVVIPVTNTTGGPSTGYIIPPPWNRVKLFNCFH